MGLSVRFMGINHKAISVLSDFALLLAGSTTEDAVGMIENVEVGKYHDYKHEYAK